jgi:hypothetical protein
MTTRRRPPGKTPETREDQVVAAAMDLAERQILDGTASSQVLTHFLKLASPREKLERERLANEVALLAAKTEAVASAGRIEALYEEAMAAMRSYKGQSDG